MREEGFQHHQPSAHNGVDDEVKEILNRITERKDRVPLSEREREVLERGGYGELVGDIDRHQKDETLPPWMH